MPAERTAMRQVRDVLRLKTAGVAINEIARRVGVASSTVRLTLKRLAAAGLGWPLPPEMTDTALEEQLFTAVGKKQGHRRLAEPDWAAVHRELKRKHVTLQILWDEYIERHPEGYRCACAGGSLPAALALLPVSGAWLDVLGLFRRPVLAGIVTLALGIVYRYAPDRAEPKWQWISWGSVAATALWIVGSIAFTTYVSRSGATTRPTARWGRHHSAALVLSTAYVILAGAELNAEIKRQTTRTKQHPVRRAPSIRVAVTAARPRRAAEGIVNCSSRRPRVGTSGSYIGSKWEF